MDITTTLDLSYTQRLESLASKWWKRLLPVQLPYAINLRRLNPGLMLDVGCGLGRNLNHVWGHGVGIDHNRHSVEACRSRGLTAYTVEDFPNSPLGRESCFDTLLFAHVLEHMHPQAATELVKAYLPRLKPEGRILIVTPQERGQRSDPSHVSFMDFGQIRSLAESLSLVVLSQRSFPLPRAFGGWFAYNEFISVLGRPAA